MTHVLASRVRETTTSTGTGDYTTSGSAVPGGFITLATKLTANGDVGWFCVVMGNEFEIVKLARVSPTIYKRVEVYENHAGTTSAVSWGAGVKDIFSVAPPIMFKRKMILNGNLTLYYRSDGGTGNLGLVDASDASQPITGAFGSIQEGYDHIVANYVIDAPWTITLVQGPTEAGVQSYSAGVIASTPWDGNGSLLVQGDSVTPTNVVINVSGANAFRVNQGCTLQGLLLIDGFRLNVSGDAGIENSAVNSRLSMGNINFNCATAFALNNNNAYVTIHDDLTIVEADTTLIDVDSGYMILINGAISASGTWTNTTEVRFDSFFYSANIWSGTPTVTFQHVIKDGAVVRLDSGVTLAGGGLILVEAGSTYTDTTNIFAFSTPATQSDMEGGSGTLKTVTPGRQHFHPGHPKVWCDGHTSGTAPNASYNVSSTADDGTGLITINYATGMSSSNYARDATAGNAQLFCHTGAKASNSCQLAARDQAGTLTDPTWWNFIAVGDFA